MGNENRLRMYEFILRVYSTDCKKGRETVGIGIAYNSEQLLDILVEGVEDDERYEVIIIPFVEGRIFDAYHFDKGCFHIINITPISTEVIQLGLLANGVFDGTTDLNLLYDGDCIYIRHNHTAMSDDVFGEVDTRDDPRHLEYIKNHPSKPIKEFYPYDIPKNPK